MTADFFGSEFEGAFLPPFLADTGRDGAFFLDFLTEKGVSGSVISRNFGRALNDAGLVPTITKCSKCAKLEVDQNCGGLRSQLAKG